MSKTTLDLSTLPDIADGTHTVKVKAKADGYRDSEFSNEVSYKYETNIAGSVTLGYTNYTNATQVQLTGVTDITLYGGNY